METLIHKPTAMRTILASPKYLSAVFVILFLSDACVAQYTNKPSRVTKVRDLWEGGLLALDLSGDGLTGWVFEGDEPLLTHVEFQGRVSLGNTPVTAPDTHHTWSCGAMAGAGIKYGTRGAAYQANIVSYNTQNVPLPYLIWQEQWSGEVQATSALVTNFSFYAWSGEYELRDDACRNATHHLAVQGADYTTPISPSTSIKNVLTIGDVNCYSRAGQGDVDDSGCSAHGPSLDGRIKPDIMSLCDTVVATYNNNCPIPDQCYSTYTCTSGATAWASGAMLLFQELNDDLNQEFLSGYALKALVIHNAYDMWNAGPDYDSGWGLLDASKTAEFLLLEGTCEDYEIYDDELSDGEVFTIDFSVSGDKPVKATATWFDEAGAQSGYLTPGTTLINNLDLRIFKLVNGVPVQEFNAYNLDPAFPSNLAYTGVNNVDNVEQVLIDSPDPGTYRIEVSHQGTLAEPQSFVVCVGENPINEDVDIVNATSETYGNGAIDISNSGVNVLSYVWTGPNSFTSSSEDITGLESGAYIVEMTTDTGCTYKRQFWVKCECDGDFNGDDVNDSLDLLGLLGVYNTTCASWGCCPGDFDNDNVIDSSDLTAFLAVYSGTCNQSTDKYRDLNDYSLALNLGIVAFFEE